MTTPFPHAVRLVDDFLDFASGVGFPAGTVLDRMPTGQYAPEGTPLGGDCVWGYPAFDEAGCEHFAMFPGGVIRVRPPMPPP